MINSIYVFVCPPVIFYVTKTEIGTKIVVSS